MKIMKYQKPVGKFQQGGQVAPNMAAADAQAVPAEEQQIQGDEQAMMQQLAQMAQEIISQMGPDAAAMLAQIIMEMLQSAQPVGEEPQGEPVFKKGGKICKRIKKCCKKSKA